MLIDVEVEYDDDGPAMAGFNGGKPMRRAEVTTVSASSPEEAERLARERFSGEHRTVRRVRVRATP